MKLEIIDKYKIQNCKFEFECEAKWDDLVQTSDPLIRVCKQCQQDVHKCESDEQLTIAVQTGKCVAVERFNSKDALVLTMGSVFYTRKGA